MDEAQGIFEAKLSEARAKYSTGREVLDHMMEWAESLPAADYRPEYDECIEDLMMESVFDGLEAKPGVSTRSTPKQSRN